MKLFRFLLLPFSLIYATAMILRNGLFNSGLRKQHKVPAFVLSIGNLSTGGTGKTPMAEYLLAWLIKQNISCALLSRGYGRKTSGFLEVNASKGNALDFGDEPLQVAMKFPDLKVVVCESRVEGAQKLLSSSPVKVIVLDDAFQHRQIQRDVNLVLIDASKPPHQDWVLPAGNLREPFSGLRRASMMIFTKVANEQQMNRLKKRYAAFEPCFCSLEMLAIIPFDKSKPERPIQDLSGKKVIAFAAIGNPSFFEGQLMAAGAKIEKFLSFADHHVFSERDLREIVRGCESSISSGETWVVTTSKDHARLQGNEGFDKLGPSLFFYIQSELKWLEGEDRLKSHIIHKMQEYAGTN